MRTVFEFGPEDTAERDLLLRFQTMQGELTDLYNSIRNTLRHGLIDSALSVKLLEETKVLLDRLIHGDY